MKCVQLHNGYPLVGFTEWMDTRQLGLLNGWIAVSGGDNADDTLLAGCTHWKGTGFCVRIDHNLLIGWQLTGIQTQRIKATGNNQ